MSSAANASAAVRLPTPAGPWKRYACATPSASAARSSRFASACSGKFSKASTDVFCELGRRLRAVHGLNAVREHLCKRTVRGVDGAVEVQAFALDAIRGFAPRERGFGIDEDEDR